MASILNNIDDCVARYEADGVIRLRELLSPDEVAIIRRELARYHREIAPSLPASEVVYEADGESVRNFWHMDRHDQYFADLGSDPHLLRLLTKLLGGKPVLMGVETFNKPAQIGSPVPVHQDNAYFCKSPPDVLTVWIAIDAATTENGPVTYYMASHTSGTLPHKPSGVSGNSMGMAEPFDRGERFTGILESGDALIHHCQAVHESEPNRSDRPRLGLLMVYRGAHTQDDPELKRRYQQAQA